MQWTDHCQSSAMRLLVAVAAAAVFFFFAAGSSPAAIPGGAVTAVKVVHLLCFATSFGATVWAIFLGSVVMFMNLPRHMMGRLRGKVFVACFALNAACTAVSAAAFAWLLHHPWRAAPPAPVERRQLGILVATAGLYLANLLLFAPRTLEMMHERHKVERGLGIGDGAGGFEGWRSNARAAMNDAALAAANRRFRRAHISSAVALIGSSSGLAAHSWYLAGKLAL